MYKSTCINLLLAYFSLFLHSLSFFLLLLITSNVSSGDLTSPSITIREDSMLSDTSFKISCKIELYVLVFHKNNVLISFEQSILVVGS